MKTLIACLMAVFAVCAVQAQDGCCPVAAQAPAAAQESWDFVGVAFFPDAPPSAGLTDVYGLKLGIPVSFGDKGKVVGVELSMIASTTKQVKGFQGALLYCKADKVTGLQANPRVNIAKEVSGLQAGIVNCSEGKTFQFGLVNYIEGAAIPVLPIVNFKF
jgi:hypothetical protein